MQSQSDRAIITHYSGGAALPLGGGIAQWIAPAMSNGCAGGGPHRAAGGKCGDRGGGRFRYAAKQADRWEGALCCFGYRDDNRCGPALCGRGVGEQPDRVCWAAKSAGGIRRRRSLPHGEGTGRGMHPALRGCIIDCLDDLLTELMQMAQARPAQIRELVITGNTAMLYLLTGGIPPAFLKLLFCRSIFLGTKSLPKPWGCMQLRPAAFICRTVPLLLLGLIACAPCLLVG